ncbi:MAG: hypothetical protein ACFFG0_23275 [Candidatus Thorarchaeota archaeon]
MKIKLYRNYKYSSLNNISEKDCRGSGTENDPVVIDGSIPLPREFLEIIDSEIFLLITNRNIKKLRITVSKNVIIKDCSIDWLWLSGCSDIKLVNVKSPSVVLEMCHNCILDDCEIRLHLFNSTHNLIKNCTIDFLESNLYLRSKDNIFENNNIHDKYLAKISNQMTYDEQVFTVTEVTPPMIKCSGTGFVEDPFIFDLKDFSDSDSIYLMESAHNILINNYNIRLIWFKRCKNKIIEDCKLKYLGIEFCSDIKIEKDIIEKLYLGESKNLSIINCTIKKVKLKRSFKGGVVFKNCTLLQIKGKSVNKVKLENSKIQKT